MLELQTAKLIAAAAAAGGCGFSLTSLYFCVTPGWLRSPLSTAEPLNCCIMPFLSPNQQCQSTEWADSGIDKSDDSIDKQRYLRANSSRFHANCHRRRCHPGEHLTTLSGRIDASEVIVPAWPWLGPAVRHNFTHPHHIIRETDSQRGGTVSEEIWRVLSCPVSMLEIQNRQCTICSRLQKNPF